MWQQPRLVAFAYIVAIAVSIVGCGSQENGGASAANRIAEKLKDASPQTTDAVKIQDFVILGEKSFAIRATLLSWNSTESVNTEFMYALAHDNAKKFACSDKAIRELLADGVELTVVYASADRKDTIETKILNGDCRN